MEMSGAVDDAFQVRSINGHKEGVHQGELFEGQTEEIRELQREVKSGKTRYDIPPNSMFTERK